MHNFWDMLHKYYHGIMVFITKLVFYEYQNIFHEIWRHIEIISLINGTKAMQ